MSQQVGLVLNGMRTDYYVKAAIDGRQVIDRRVQMDGRSIVHPANDPGMFLQILRVENIKIEDVGPAQNWSVQRSDFQDGA